MKYISWGNVYNTLPRGCLIRNIVYIVIPTLRVGDYVMIHIEDMVLTRVGVYHV